MSRNGTRETLARLARRVAWHDREPVPSWAHRALAIGTRQAYSTAEVHTIRRNAARLVALASAADSATVAHGLTWYATARALAVETLMLARTENHGAPIGVTMRGAAYALAAVSPGMPWARNGDALAAVLTLAMHGTTDARDVRAYIRTLPLPVPYGYRPYVDAVRVAIDPDAITGPKRRAFAIGTDSAGDTVHVAADGHATLAAAIGAVARRPGITAARTPTGRAYDVVSASYALACERLLQDSPAAWAGSTLPGRERPRLTPARLQAVVWLAWRAIPTNGGAS